MSDVEILPKISVKTVGADGAAAKVYKKDVPLMRVWGQARNIKATTGNDGSPVFGLTGAFRATNIAEKKEFASAVLYLPGGILEMILDPLEQILNGDDKAAKQNGVEFAFDIFSLPATNKAGYTFKAASLIESRQTDPLAAMTEALGKQALPALPKAPGS